MYKSPIELLVTDIQHQIEKQHDENIYKAALHYVPNVDRAELLRALQYDRNQYEKGYADAMATIVRCKDCKGMNEDKFCVAWEGFVREDDFCSYGERREENGC